MTDTELDALEAKAKAATSGPWWELDTEKDTTVDNQIVKDSIYIAAANPAVILELIAELRQVRRERDWLASQLEGACYSAEDAEYCSLHDCNDCKYTSAKVWLEAAKEAVK